MRAHRNGATTVATVSAVATSAASLPGWLRRPAIPPAPDARWSRTGGFDVVRDRPPSTPEGTPAPACALRRRPLPRRPRPPTRSWPPPRCSLNPRPSGRVLGTIGNPKTPRPGRSGGFHRRGRSEALPLSTSAPPTPLPSRRGHRCPTAYTRKWVRAIHGEDLGRPWGVVRNQFPESFPILLPFESFTTLDP